MNPEMPGAPPPPPPGPPVGGAVPPGPEPSAPWTGGPIPPPPGGGTSWGDWSSGPSWRDVRRAERHARREARRGEWGIGSAWWGILLVIIGAGFLASELIPDFDWNLAWPGVLIACGVLLIAGALRRPAAGP